jgi:hypothetical protein
MQSQCDRCDATTDSDRGEALCEACLDSESPTKKPDSAKAPEFDHRGIRMPARSRVGGIIIPQ